MADPCSILVRHQIVTNRMLWRVTECILGGLIERQAMLLSPPLVYQRRILTLVIEDKNYQFATNLTRFGISWETNGIVILNHEEKVLYSFNKLPSRNCVVTHTLLGLRLILTLNIVFMSFLFTLYIYNKVGNTYDI